ncbi:hypothetical protein BI364_15205 [Acidihalobacter yilgarnensis]|uniref:Cytochrome b/b6 N-terminal region profile domain-containing protein n=1 Tax=Acidihalobacter yilgarnensis TaxID=2819280 RepID=A0A1D8IRS8_9GAMM|nr:cytochrome b N-terminal domain-containing protein [Acidihalobacter yilgarnensis]AOU99107.1 hypothetical protein BI364_15205 [Acidihalobacter yilgarnensis]
MASVNASAAPDLGTKVKALRSRFWRVLGAMSIVLIGIQFITGVFLLMSYHPGGADGSGAYNSVMSIMYDVRWGWLVRYIHTTGASLLFIIVYIHMFRALWDRTYKKRNGKVWLWGVSLLVLLMGEEFFGYILPYGNMSLWGGMVITNLFGSIPLIGHDLITWIRGGPLVSTPTINRFMAFHVAVIPMALVALIVMHLQNLYALRIEQEASRSAQR